LLFNPILVKKGRANMVLKDSTKRRRRKSEIESEKKRKFEEEKENAELKATNSILVSKNIQPSSVPQIVQQNDELVAYVKRMGLMDDNGNFKA